MKILAQRPNHISAVATVLLITKTFRERERERERALQNHFKRIKESDRRLDIYLYIMYKTRSHLAYCP